MNPGLMIGRSGVAVPARIFPGRGGGKRATILGGFKSACESAGLTYGQRPPDGVVPHTLRRTRISWWLQEGRGYGPVGAIVGHTAATMTAKYGHYSEADLLAVVQPVVTLMDTTPGRSSRPSLQVVDCEGASARERA
jgi:integrase